MLRTRVLSRAVITAAALAVAIGLGISVAVAEPTLEWIRQFGTSEDDYAVGVTADLLGNVYVAGTTGGVLEGTSAGGRDAYLSKYDATGSLVWARQFGTTSNDNGEGGVVTDALGNVYIAGSMQGDAFLAKYDAGGTLQWSQYWATPEPDTAGSVSVDGRGNIYIAGMTGEDPGIGGNRDVLIAKYDANGTRLWSWQFGTDESDWGYGVSADGLGNVYVAGRTWGDLAGPHLDGRDDGFLVKYDTNGNFQWGQQLNGIAEGVSADGLGNVYVADIGGSVSKFDAGGTLQWTSPVGISGGQGVSTDGQGNVYVSGATTGLGHAPPAQSNPDVYVAKLDADGALQWTRQLGTAFSGAGTKPFFDNFEYCGNVFADGAGNVYVAGSTTASLWGPNAGGQFGFDGFVAKFVDLPGLAGDFNGDGSVDAADYVVWREGRFTTYTAASYDIWKANFGATSSGASLDVAIPEPATAVLVVASVLSLVVLMNTAPRCIQGKRKTEGAMLRTRVLSSVASTVAALAVAIGLGVSMAVAEPTLEWIRQWGTSEREVLVHVSADGLGNVYLSGVTGSGAGGDRFVIKYEAEGTLQWEQRFDTGVGDWGSGVSADGLGNVYISGATETGQAWYNYDAFVSKYDADGTLLWWSCEYVGDDDPSPWGGESEIPWDASVDGLGNVYIAGKKLEDTATGPTDGFVTKYDAEGVHQWTQRQDREIRTVSADVLGNVYVAGPESLAKYDPNGTLEWAQEPNRGFF